jgi:putative DNA primase/helicase
MSLKPIVDALGGDLYAGGRRASIPAPGHSAQDRSISLLRSGDRLIIHGFGGADWREARDDLVRRGLLDRTGRLKIAGGGSASSIEPPKPDDRVRRRTAARLWDDGLVLTRGQAAGRYLARRCVVGALSAADLRHHPAAPVSVYRDGGAARPALMARITAPDDQLTAVELTYLELGGALAGTLRLPRKTVGLVPEGSAVRLASPTDRLLVAEGVITTLSAMAWFGLPGWALMAVRNLAVWSPPSGVRHVTVAGDRGEPGEMAAERLRRRLVLMGLSVDIHLPEPPFGDWNEATVARWRTEEGRGAAPERRG